MSDHHHYEYAEARHDHRGEYAAERHDHDLEYAERHHRHHDDERAVGELRRQLADVRRALGEFRDELNEALDRIRQLEQQTPQARQLQLEADQAAADLAEHGDEPAAATSPRRAVCTLAVDGGEWPGSWVCGRPIDHEPDELCPGNPHARPAPEGGQS